MDVRCHLAMIRQQRGISAANLARRVGVQRQTIYSIEAGVYVPNTALSLMLARELEVAVEDLFNLPPEPARQQPAVPSHVLSAGPVKAGTPVRMARLGTRQIAVPLHPSPCFLMDADGVLQRTANAEAVAPVTVLAALRDSPEPVLIAGCDPALGLVPAETREAVVIPVPACSRVAIEWLRKGLVHLAGCHLEDAKTGEYNLHALREFLPGEDLEVLTFAEWEEGFVVAPGNPLGIREAGDLANSRVRLMNREPGSGSRALLDTLLRRAGIGVRQIAGYRSVASSHLGAARAVAEGQADCCVATSSAAQAFHLGFVPLRKERFDLVLRREYLHLPGVRAVLETLQRQSLRRKLETLAGYDTRNTGKQVLH